MGEHEDSQSASPSQPDLEPGADTQMEINRRIFERLFPDDEPEPEQVRRFGRYEVSRRLGVGGMSVVYLARDPQLDREVAIKVLQPDEDRFGEDERTLLIEEAKAMARLVHPNVVTVFDVGEHEGALYLALERVEGRDLRQWQSAGARSWREVVEVYVGAARGLEAAHRAGIIHRDFKPDNVLLTQDGVAKVMDFGLARVSESDHSRVAQSIGPAAVSEEDRQDLEHMKLSGTPAYMAPERIRGEHGDEAADQFSFCVSLYESLCGQRPFVGQTVLTLMTRIATGEREPRPEQVDVPTSVWRVIERGLRAEPSERHPSMTSLRAELERCLVPRWRRYGVALVGGGLVASAAVGALANRGIEPDVCGDAIARVEHTWDDAGRERVRQSIVGTELRYAADTWERIDARVGRWVERWSDRRRQTCEARHEDSRADRRAECFESQRLELEAVVELLATPDPEIVEKALDVVALLSDPTRCEDDEWLSSGVPLPVEPDLRAQVLALREGFEAVRVLLSAAKLEPALARSTEQLTRAEASGHGPSIAEARLQLGITHSRQGDHDRGRDLLLDAFTEATRVDAPRIASEAGIQLMSVEGLRLSKQDEGRTWSRLAEGQIARLGRAGRALEADRLLYMAEIERTAGDLDASLALIQDARTILEDVLPEEHPEWINVLGAQAAVLETHGEYEDSIALNFEAVDRIERSMGPEHPMLVSYLTMLGISLSRRDRIEQAEPHMVRAMELSERIYGPDHPNVARALNNLSSVVAQKGQLEEAIELLERARTIRVKELGAEHPRVAKVEMNMGIMHNQLGHHDTAIELQQHALTVTETHAGPRSPDLIGILINLSLPLIERTRGGEAIVALERAEDLVAELFGTDHVQMAFVQINLAYARRTEGQLLPALDAAQRAEAVLKATLGPENMQMMEILGVHGALLVQLERYPDAEVVLLRTIDLIEKFGAFGEGPGQTRYWLARAYWGLGRRAEATAMAQQAREGASEALLKQLDAWESTREG